jgi:hypothetical protein
MLSKTFLKFVLLLLIATLCAQDAFAIPVGGVQEDTSSGTFEIADGIATVDSTVYSYESGEYVYAYQISNSSSVGISFFSVSIATDADAFEASWDIDSGVAEPAFWNTVGSPVQSVDGLFVDTIDSDDLSSAVLWFKSIHSPTLGSGVLFGSSSGVPYSATGSVLTPSATPEPATILLLGIGSAFITLTRKRRSV